MTRARTDQIRLAVIAGDGIGPEVIDQARRVLRAAVPAGVTLDETEFTLGAAHYLEAGEILSEATLESLRDHDAILLGAVGGDPKDARLAGGIIERGLLLKLRFAFDHAVNLRPSTLFEGETSALADPGTIDFVVVREGTEGPYVGNGGSMRTGTPDEVATEVSINTVHGVRRVVRFAFEQAAGRRGKLTLVHKKNVLVHAGELWQRIVNEAAVDWPAVQTEYLHVDAATIHLVADPARFDVIVTDNLFGDILTDLAGAVSGGIGLAASANLNLEGTAPSMFEPVHGSAPDIAGQGIADPRAAILSAAMLLDHFGLGAEALAVRSAVEADVKRGQSGRSTSEIGDAILDLLSTSHETSTA